MHAQVAEQHVRKRRCCRAEPNRKKGQNLTPAEQLRLRNLGYGSPEAKSKGNKQKPKSPEEARKDAAHNEEDFDADKLGLLMDGTPKSRGYKSVHTLVSTVVKQYLRIRVICLIQVIDTLKCVAGCQVRII